MLLDFAATPRWHGVLQDCFRVAIGEEGKHTALHVCSFVWAGGSGTCTCQPGSSPHPQTLPNVCAGTRVLLDAVVGCILHQPPLAVLLQQCAIMALVANNPGYCARPLLADPLSQHRLDTFAQWLDTALVAVVPLTGANPNSKAGRGKSASRLGAANACSVVGVASCLCKRPVIFGIEPRHPCSAILQPTAGLLAGQSSACCSCWSAFCCQPWLLQFGAQSRATCWRSSSSRSLRRGGDWGVQQQQRGRLGGA